MNGIKIGSTVYSKKGTRATVMSVSGDSIGIMTNAGIRLVNITSLVTNPRDAVVHSPGRIEVDLDRLSLDYRPSVITPSWEPTTSVKPYEQLTKLYLDIETTGLDPTVEREARHQGGRVLMVGLMSEAGVKTIITDPDERMILTRSIEHLKTNKPDCLIGHNPINFDIPFIVTRCRINKIQHPFTKAPKTTRITSSSVNGQPIEFTPVY
jgi:DNA polymerase, archaea type